MSKSSKKASAKAAAPKPEHEPGAFIDDEVVHVPKGKSPLQFYLVLALMLFVLIIFTVGDQLMNSVGRRDAGPAEDYMVWTHPEEGVQRYSQQDLMMVKRAVSNFFRVQGVQAPRQLTSDESVAGMIITDRLASEAGIEIPSLELGKIILEGDGSIMQGFFNGQNYKSRLQAARVSTTEFESTLRMIVRSNRYQTLLARSLAEPMPEDFERLWNADHQEYAFDLVRLPLGNLRAEAEALAPDTMGMATWYDGLSEPERELNFGDAYLPERYAVALLSWDASSEAPAVLLERFPRPEATDLDQLARIHYDRYLSRRYLKPVEEPADEPAEGEEDGPPALDDLYLPFDDVAESAKLEAQVLAAMTDLLADLRARLEGGEELDLATLAEELGLKYESDGLPRSREEWSQFTDPYLANEVGSTGPNGVFRVPVVGESRLWVGRMLERRPVEPPLYSDVADQAREVWLTEKTSELARARLDELRAKFAEPEGEAGDEAGAEDEATDLATLLAAAGAPVSAERDAFLEAAQSAGLEVLRQEWFDPTRASDLPEDEQPAQEAFLRSAWYPGMDLFTLEDGQVSAPRADADGEAMWLVRSNGARDPEELGITPSEYQALRQRALFENMGEVGQALTGTDELAARYSLAFPGRRDEDI